MAFRIHDSVGRFIFEFQTAGVKLGGALSGIAEGRDFTDAAFTVARQELFEIREGILKLMDEFRGRK